MQRGFGNLVISAKPSRVTAFEDASSSSDEDQKKPLPPKISAPIKKPEEVKPKIEEPAKPVEEEVPRPPS